MIKHIVIFRLKDDIDEAVKQQVMNNFKRDIEALPSVIGCIEHIHVGLNVNPEEACHICLTSSFASLNDLCAYATHPAHQAIAARLKPYVAGRSCVDFEE